MAWARSETPSIHRAALTLTELDRITQRQAAEILGICLSGMQSRVQLSEALKDLLHHHARCARTGGFLRASARRNLSNGAETRQLFPARCLDRERITIGRMPSMNGAPRLNLRNMTMRLKRSDQIAGFPALDLRPLLQPGRVTPYWAAKCLGGLSEPIDGLSADTINTEGMRIIRRLVEAGLLTDDERAVDELAIKGQLWALTDAGIKIAHAIAGRGLKRSKAKEMLEGIIERARALNADQHRLWTVTKFIVFGSYLNEPDKEELGDLDLLYELTPRLSGDAYGKALNMASKRAIASGFCSRNMVQEHFAGEHVFTRAFLGIGSRLLRAQCLCTDLVKWISDKPHEIVFSAKVGWCVDLAAPCRR